MNRDEIILQVQGELGLIAQQLKSASDRLDALISNDTEQQMRDEIERLPTVAEDMEFPLSSPGQHEIPIDDEREEPQFTVFEFATHGDYLTISGPLAELVATITNLPEYPQGVGFLKTDKIKYLSMIEAADESFVITVDGKDVSLKQAQQGQQQGGAEVKKIKYADAQGNTWSGRGRPPAWIAAYDKTQWDQFLI